MKIVSGNQADLSPGLYADLGCYRHEVFVELLQWDLNTPEGIRPVVCCLRLYPREGRDGISGNPCAGKRGSR